MDFLFLVQIKEIQLEARNLQHQLYMAEEQLRLENCNNITFSLLLSYRTLIISFLLDN
jgi:hypothetical protein